jgi:hypothetical protein
MKQRALIFQLAAWGLSLAAATLAFIAWGQDNFWQLGHLSVYQIFPLLGLMAWSIMWSHYVAGAGRQLFKLEPAVLKRYYSATGWVVLVLICLHPGLLIFRRFQDGHGLPPGSYESYVAPGLAWITLLGTASLLVFLAFELHRWFGRRPWWHWVAEAGDLAMLAIFYHGLRLGSQLSHQGWFLKLWWFYGLSLIAVLARSYYVKYLMPKPKTKPAT